MIFSKSESLFRRGNGGRLLLAIKNLLLSVLANSLDLISLSASITHDTDFFEEEPESCFRDFHHELASSQFFTFFSKKELRRRIGGETGHLSFPNPRGLQCTSRNWTKEILSF